MQILITGASGCGTSTLGQALAAHLSWGCIDLDDYYWVPTVPPFREKRDSASRLARLQDEMARHDDLVVSGSLMEWGIEVENSFSLIVFLTVPAAVRVHRLERREIQRYGIRDDAFLAWAAQYEEGTLPGRNRRRHEAWLAQRTCPILRIDGTPTVSESLRIVLGQLVRPQSGA